MRSILKLLFANIRHRKGAFAGIIILMAVISLSYAITVSNDRNLSVLLTEGYTAQGGGDWMVSFSAADMQEEGIDSLRRHSAVEKVTETERLFLIGKSDAEDCVTFFLEDSDCYPVFNAEGDGFAEHTPLQRGEVDAAQRHAVKARAAHIHGAVGGGEGIEGVDDRKNAAVHTAGRRHG